MLNVESFKNALLKVFLFALAGFIFLVSTVAFGHVVFGVLAGALYVYEVARI